MVRQRFYFTILKNIKYRIITINFILKDLSYPKHSSDKKSWHNNNNNYEMCLYLNFHISSTLTLTI